MLLAAQRLVRAGKVRARRRASKAWRQREEERRARVAHTEWEGAMPGERSQRFTWKEEEEVQRGLDGSLQEGSGAAAVIAQRQQRAAQQQAGSSAAHAQAGGANAVKKSAPQSRKSVASDAPGAAVNLSEADGETTESSHTHTRQPGDRALMFTRTAWETIEKTLRAASRDDPEPAEQRKGDG